MTNQVFERIGLTAIFVVLGFISVYLLRRSWRRKADALPLSPLVEVEHHDFLVTCSGRYLGTNLAEDWLSRIVAHGLGFPARGAISWTPFGVVVQRIGSPDFLIPTAAILDVLPDRAAAGKVFEKNSVILLKWQHDGHQLASGFRADRTEAQIVFLKHYKERFSK